METQQSTQLFQYWIGQIQKIQFKIIILFCIIVWTPFLTIATLQVQHSCHPMIAWTIKIPASCSQETARYRYWQEHQQAQKLLEIYRHNKPQHTLTNKLKKVQSLTMESLGF